MELTPFQKVAKIGLIDTPETVQAIYTLDIPEIHKLQICNCLAGIQFHIGNGIAPATVMSMRYQDIVTGLKPTDTSLTDGQRQLVLDTVLTSVLIGIDALKAQVLSAVMPTEITQEQV